MTPVLGIDPGGRATGYCLLDGDTLLSAGVVTRDGEDWARYYAELTDLVPATLPPLVVAIEGLSKPCPHLGLTNVSGLISTARVLGVVEAHAHVHGHHVVIIPPGRNGSAPLATYPPALVGPRDNGGGILRHARSAYDVARAALVLELAS